MFQKFLVLGLSVFAFSLIAGCSTAAPESDDSKIIHVDESDDSAMQESVVVEESADVSSSSVEGEVVEFTVEGSSFKFAPNVLTVQEGDTVRITFKNVGGSHDFVLNEFDARTTVISSGTQDVVEFVASKKGSFEFYCSVGDHRALGMVGTLTVE